jgi:hypothetical protein
MKRHHPDHLYRHVDFMSTIHEVAVKVNIKLKHPAENANKGKQN